MTSETTIFQTAAFADEPLGLARRTRIKICGLTRPGDVAAAVEAGADAIGLVCYPSSPRYVAPDTAAELMAGLPPFVSAVGLFVNADAKRVAEVVERAPVALLQFHGDETIDECADIAGHVGRPFLKAVRMAPGIGADDLLELDRSCRAASGLFAGLLLDAFADGYGGSGKVFDWSLIPEKLAPRVVLSGGLSAQNAIDAVRRVRPWAVDVSSGVELSKGIKDAAKIDAFVRQIRQADGA